MIFAIVDHDTVFNTVVADAPLDSNWIDITNLDPMPGIGWSYDSGAGTFTAPVAPTPPVEPKPWEWFIDIGPFYDRFGAAKMDVLVSQDVTIKAILADISIRKWIDLKRADVEQSLIYIGSKAPSVNATLRQAILTTPVSELENAALRKLYF